MNVRHTLLAIVFVIVHAGCGVGAYPLQPVLRVPEACWTEGFQELQKAGVPQIHPFHQDTQDLARKMNTEEMMTLFVHHKIWGSFSYIQLELLSERTMSYQSFYSNSKQLTAVLAMSHRKTYSKNSYVTIC